MEKKSTPKYIWYSLYAFLCSLVIVIFDISIYTNKFSSFDVKALFLELTINIFLILLIFRRKNWARIVYTIITFLAIISALLLLKNISNNSLYNIISLFLQVVLRIVSVYFLFLKNSREWFKPSHSTIIINTTQQNDEYLHHPDVIANANEKSPNISSPKQIYLKKRMSQFTKLWIKLKDKKKPLLGVASALIICIFLILIFIGNKEIKSNTIRRAFRADVELHHQIFNNNSSDSCDAETVQTYAQGLRKIDMTHCPRDFQNAYLDHIHAWENLAHSRDSFNLISIIIPLLQGNLPNIPNEQPLEQDIIKTWNEIEKIALSYGVKLQE